MEVVLSAAVLIVGFLIYYWLQATRPYVAPKWHDEECEICMKDKADAKN